jgi:hypothetical protein
LAHDVGRVDPEAIEQRRDLSEHVRRGRERALDDDERGRPFSTGR